MNMIVHQGGTNYGPYSIDEMRSYLESGNLRNDDYVWCEGFTEWTRVSEVIERFSSQATLSASLGGKATIDASVNQPVVNEVTRNDELAWTGQSDTLSPVGADRIKADPLGQSAPKDRGNKVTKKLIARNPSRAKNYGVIDRSLINL